MMKNNVVWTLDHLNFFSVVGLFLWKKIKKNLLLLLKLSFIICITKIDHGYFFYLMERFRSHLKTAHIYFKNVVLRYHHKPVHVTGKPYYSPYGLHRYFL